MLKDNADLAAHIAKLPIVGKAIGRIGYKYSSTSRFAHLHCAFSFPRQPLKGIPGSLTKTPSTSFGVTLLCLLLSLITSQTYHTRSPHSKRQPSQRVSALEVRSGVRSSAFVPPHLGGVRLRVMGLVWTSTDSVSVCCVLAQNHAFSFAGKIFPA